MDKPVVFISYSHRDERWKEQLEEHLQVLQHLGRFTYWDDRQIPIGETWRLAINTGLASAQAAILLISRHFLASKFIQDVEVPTLLQRKIRDGLPIFPVILSACSWQDVPWLAPLQVRPRDGQPLTSLRGHKRDDAFTRLVEEIRHIVSSDHAVMPFTQPAQRTTLTNTLTERTPGDVCPYRGLEVFREEDAHFFFGCEAFAHQLLRKVTQEQLPLITVVGASGSGKSSVVRAGLLPRLRLEQSTVWDAAIFTPGDAPFRNLAEALALVEDTKLDPWQRRVKANKRGAYLASGQLTITDAVDITLESTKGTDRLLLVVDQFEELFRMTSEADRRLFIDSLLSSLQTAPFTLLLTLRADFFEQALTLSRELWICCRRASSP